MRRALVSLVGAALLAGCSVVGIRTGYEEPAYDVVERIDDDLEIRHYAPRLAVETTVDATGSAGRNEAFRRLFDYISGANRPAAKVAMTVPVETETTAATIEMTVPVETVRSADEGSTMRFFLPATYARSTAPEPTDSRVVVVELPRVTVAVLRFTGSWDEASVSSRKAELLARLQASSWRPLGDARTLFYDPPWTLPFLRRNEVAIEVQPAR